MRIVGLKGIGVRNTLDINFYDDEVERYKVFNVDLLAIPFWKVAGNSPGTVKRQQLETC